MNAVHDYICSLRHWSDIASSIAVVCNVFNILWNFGGISLCIESANERRPYNVRSSMIGWAHTQNDLCLEYFDLSVRALSEIIVSKWGHCLTKNFFARIADSERLSSIMTSDWLAMSYHTISSHVRKYSPHNSDFKQESCW